LLCRSRKLLQYPSFASGISTLVHLSSKLPFR
jgi:hypothetical protein